MLSRILCEKAIPRSSGPELLGVTRTSGDILKFVPHCVDYGFEDIKRDPVSFYNKEHIVIPAKDTIRRSRDYWETKDNRKIVYRSCGIGDQSEAGVYAEAHFRIQNVGQLKAGFAFRFPYWTKKSWPNRNYGDIDFVISVRDEQTSSVMFQTENLRVFHFSHFADPPPWMGEQQRMFPLESVYVLPLDDYVVKRSLPVAPSHPVDHSYRRPVHDEHHFDRRFLPIPPSHPVDHSYWRLLECRGIPTSRNRTSVITLSLKSRSDSRPPSDEGLELDSFWIAEQTDVSEIEPKSWRTLSAMQREENGSIELVDKLMSTSP